MGTWYLSAGQRTLAPDGSRWIIAVGGSTKLLNFRTGEVVDLGLPGGFQTAWSPDSSVLGIWNPHQAGVLLFDGTGRLITEEPVDVGKRRVSLDNDARVTVFEPNRASAIAFTTYGANGGWAEARTCAIPTDYPDGQASVHLDGHHLRVEGLIDKGKAVYRFTVIDLETGNVVSDMTHTGYVPYVNQLVWPGIYMAGIEGASDGVYAADPSTGDMLRLTSLAPFTGQEGYENQPNSQFATDLVFR